MTAIVQRFVPSFAERWLQSEPDTRHRTVAGTMVYIDISGFTQLSERLIDYGRVGAEELVSVLGGVIAAAKGPALPRHRSRDAQQGRLSNFRMR